MEDNDRNTAKPARRAACTQRAVKDAMLQLLEQQSYEKLTVAALCRQAGITRSTFYLHYQNMDDVLNELLDEAVMAAENVMQESELRTRLAMQEELIRTGSSEDLRQNQRLLSPCQRLADDPRYRAIFQDPTLSSYVISRVYRMERDEMIPFLMEHCHISREQADRLFMMVVFGLFYLNRSLNWSKDDNWFEMQFLALQFVLGGWNSLRNRPGRTC